MNTKTFAPVQLEVNRTGLWHKVVEFEAHDTHADAYMRQSVELLGAIDQRASFRVVTRTLSRDTLLTYSNTHGWNAA